MVKLINMRTIQANQVQVDSAEDNQNITVDQPAAPEKRMRNILRSIFAGWISCLITSGWSVRVIED